MVDSYELHKAEVEFLRHAADAEDAERIVSNSPAQEMYAAITAQEKWQAAIDACAIIGFTPEGAPPTETSEASLWNKALTASARIEQAEERWSKALEAIYDIVDLNSFPPVGRDDALRRAEMADEMAQYELARAQGRGTDHHLHPSSTKNMFLNDAADLREYAESAACAHMDAVCMSDFGQRLLFEGFNPKQVQDTMIIHAMQKEEFLYGSDLNRGQALKRILQTSAVPETETERYAALAVAAGRSFVMSTGEITTDAIAAVPMLDVDTAKQVCSMSAKPKSVESAKVTEEVDLADIDAKLKDFDQTIETDAERSFEGARERADHRFVSELSRDMAEHFRTRGNDCAARKWTARAERADKVRGKTWGERTADRSGWVRE